MAVARLNNTAVRCLQGFCSLLIQWQPQQALVTTLEEYRQMGSNAPAHFAMTCYTELAISHQLVLLRGDVLRPELINTAGVCTVLAAFCEIPASN
jgi:hypothetical protein